MASVDNRVVAMNFENSKFESGVTKTLGTLAKLKQALLFQGSAQGLQQVESQLNNTNLGRLGSAIEGLSAKFGALRIAGIAALSGLAVQATMAGTQLIKSLTISPITDGLKEYETNLNSIQTILANTQADGTNLRDVNGALQELNKYSDETIYNFSEMARNIGTFTAAGVKLDTATESIKGIANLAALSGSNSQQASTAMYQLSQAIAAGKVSLEDWNSVVNAGMGGQVFQKALFDTAKTMGTLTGVPVGQTFDQWKKAGNSFRQSLSATNKAANDGAKNLAKAQEDSAKSVKKAQESAAEAVSNAKKRVTEAQKAVATTAKQSARDVANAVKQQNLDIKTSVATLRDAFNEIGAARKKLEDAMKPASATELESASDNLLTAQLDQKDLADAVTEAQREQTRAAEDLQAAQTALANTKASENATPDDLLSAQRAVENAQKRVTDAADAQTRALLDQRAAARSVNEAQEELQKTKQKGTAADDAVKEAQKGLTDAQKAYVEAQKRFFAELDAGEKNSAEVKKQAAAQKRQANDQLAEAEKAQAKTIKDTQEQVAEAYESAEERISAAKEAMAGPPKNESWLTSDVLTSTLSQFTGDMTKAELAAKGFSAEQIKAIQLQAATAKSAATEAKTLSQVFGIAKESMGSGWAQTWQIIFGDFQEAKTLFTGMAEGIKGLIEGSAESRNKVLSDWKAGGGRTFLIAGLTAAMENLGRIIKPIGQAFRDVFPAKTGGQLASMTRQFSAFTQSLRISDETMKNLRRTFAGLFAIFSIGKQIVSGIFSIFKELFKAATSGSGGVLEFTGNLGDFLVSVDKAMKEGDGLANVFKTIGKVLAIPIRLLSALSEALLGLFDGDTSDNADDARKSLEGLGDSLGPLTALVEGFGKAWGGFLNLLGDVGTAIGEALGSVGDALSDAFSSQNFDKTLDVLQVGLLGGIAVMLKRFFSNITGSFGQGLLGNIGDSFDALTGSLQAMQTNIQADTLKKIAIAVALLAGSVVALSLIDGDKLKTSLGALTIAMGQLLGAMAILVKISGAAGFVKLPIIAGSMILLALAVDALVLAVLALSQLDWQELSKGLVGVAGLLAAVSAAAIPLSKNSAGLISAGLGMIALALALKVLASVVKDFGEMDWGMIGKGLAGVAGSLVAVAAASKLFPPGMVAIGVGLVGVAFGLKLLADSVTEFGGMDWGTIAKGIGSIAIVVASIGAAMKLFPPNMAVQAAGLVLVALALQGLAKAVNAMGSMSFEEIAKGLLTLGGALAILAVGLTAMTGTIGGSAALGIASLALGALVPSLKALGKMSWGSIVKGLVTLGAALAILGVAGVALAPVTPVLLGLGLALLAIGGGIALAGTGLGLIAAGISALVVAGPAGIKIMTQALLAFAETIPKFVESFVTGLLKMVLKVAEAAPKFVVAVGKILVAMAEAIIVAAPKIAEAFATIVIQALRLLRDLFPDIVRTGFEMLMTLLKGIYDNIDQVAKMVVKIVGKLITTIIGMFGDIVAVGARLLGKLLSGIVSNLDDVIVAGAKVVARFATGIVNAYQTIYEKGSSLIGRVTAGIASEIEKVKDKGEDIVSKLSAGIAGAASKIVDKGKSFVGDITGGIAQKIDDVKSKGGEIITKLLTGIKETAEDKVNGIGAKALEIGKNIIKGIAEGIKDVDIGKLLGGIFKGALKKLKEKLKINSPSKVFRDEIGKSVIEGLVAGIDNDGHKLVTAVQDTADTMVDSFANTLSVVPDILDGVMDYQPVIAPVLDLTAVENEAKKLSDLTAVAPIDTSASFGQANAISASQQAPEVTPDPAPVEPVAPVQITQNNYSPEALSGPEIYRQTRNLFSQTKDKLDKAS